MSDIFRSGCPIATTLDLVGDKWTLVLIRDMLNGKARYSEFLDSPERITTNILASRLEAMTANGLVERKPYQERPTRYAYRLTEKGSELHPVLLAICAWANRHYPESWVPPASFMEPLEA
ncbi:winged helix-turn-helix transcriptional regulator [Parasphingopyxis lamellibrachiae]|uniref:HxlR family transcriptional regulator n=1 Tax=Parasphingopyxis lamellibrachiae TaxID=680125 RepID=A0A3D9FF55_9SPHN|nr:helix-turn-helix domain-containing protein [Parasphingopyxis lamellibrachiae]RED16444.1 HxlR family transcriptional regulator [Parasphingopyxis lamellibrachiae]